jgi:hypothetical protein
VTMEQALNEAMHRGTAEGAMGALIERGFAIADEDTMSQAIHNVYCGIMADHDHPNEKDHDQAKQLILAVGQALGARPGQQGQ